MEVLEFPDSFSSSKPPYSSGIVQQATFDDTKGRFFFWSRHLVIFLGSGLIEGTVGQRQNMRPQDLEQVETLRILAWMG